MGCFECILFVGRIYDRGISIDDTFNYSLGSFVGVIGRIRCVSFFDFDGREVEGGVEDTVRRGL